MEYKYEWRGWFFISGQLSAIIWPPRGLEELPRYDRRRRRPEIRNYNGVPWRAEISETKIDRLAAHTQDGRASPRCFGAGGRDLNINTPLPRVAPEKTAFVFGLSLSRSAAEN